jgi:hypothetical protein
MTESATSRRDFIRLSSLATVGAALGSSGAPATAAAQAKGDAFDINATFGEFIANIRPGIVYLSMGAYSWDGPWADRGGFDMEGLSASGFTLEEDGGVPRFLVRGGDLPVWLD